MPRLRAMFGGALLGVWLFNSIGIAAEFSVAGGLIATILYDAPHNSQERKRLSKIASEQALRISYGEQQLLAFANQCDQLQIMVHSRDEQLRTALTELERRDSVGAPEARNLIKSQRKALKVQKKSMEEAQQLIRAQQRMLNKLESQTNAGHERWEETLATLERMISNQANHNNSTEQQLLDQVTIGNRELQKTLTDLLQQLAMEPRTSNVNVQDSVVMKSGPEISHQQPRGKPHIPTIQAIPIGKPQRTTEVEWMKSLPKDLT
ncbi:MAG: hypothetical protein P8Q39_00900 [Candidatus Thalassarchaeaceae archaeon]|nr:hypothetical protein [Candidatus Thalassarchaeaceae archaeon]